jgi:hypothetical protein
LSTISENLLNPNLLNPSEITQQKPAFGRDFYFCLLTP